MGGEKFRIRETLNISMCAYSSTDTKTDRKNIKRKKKVMCHMSRVMCHLSRVTCHLSLTPMATAPPTANSPIRHIRLVCKDPKKKPKKISHTSLYGISVLIVPAQDLFDVYKKN